MKGFSKKYLLFLALLFATFAKADFKFPDRPTGRINDYAGVISAGSLEKIENSYAKFERDTGHQAVAVLVKSLEGDPIEDAANRLFEKWGIGDKKRNDGILLLIATDDRAVRIEVGYGLEGQIPDAVAKRIIAEDLTPFFRKSEFSTALMVFQNRLYEILSSGSAQQNRSGAPFASTLFFLLLLVSFPFFLLLLKRIASRQGRHPFDRTYRSRGIFNDRNPWLGGGFGGGGFGGFGGGGGLSGGGGASGRW